MRWIFYGIGLASLPVVYLVVAHLNGEPINWGGLGIMAFIISTPLLLIFFTILENNTRPAWLIESLLMGVTWLLELIGTLLVAAVWLLSPLLTRLSGRSTQKIKSEEQFVSSFGNFKCGPFPFPPSTAKYAFGPHGGTVVIDDEFTRMRIDVEELSPPVDPAALDEMRDALYRGYLMENIMPLVQSGVPQAKLLDAKLTIIGNYRVLLSAILMPETGEIRGQVQYTNGRFMFTVSRNTTIALDQTPETQLPVAYRVAEFAFGLCEFPQ